MSTKRDCPNCGESFLKGMRCLHAKHGRLTRRLCCLRCARKAERIIAFAESEPCRTPGCPNHARVCDPCLGALVAAAHHGSVTTVAAEVRAMLSVIKMTEQKETNVDVRSFLAGKVQGIEGVLHLLLQGVRKEGTG